MRIVPHLFDSVFDESILLTLSPASVRMHQAFYCYDRFRLACGHPAYRLQGEPHQNQWLWMTYADSFLALIVSVGDVVEKDQTRGTIRHELHDLPIYCFLKQLRNVTIHKTVLAARPPSPSNEPPLVGRIWQGSSGSSKSRVDPVDPDIQFEHMNELLGVIERTKHNQHVKKSKEFISDLAKQRKKSIILREVFEQGLDIVGNLCGIPMETAALD